MGTSIGEDGEDCPLAILALAIRPSDRRSSTNFVDLGSYSLLDLLRFLRDLDDSVPQLPCLERSEFLGLLDPLDDLHVRRLAFDFGEHLGEILAQRRILGGLLLHLCFEVRSGTIRIGLETVQSFVCRRVALELRPQSFSETLRFSLHVFSGLSYEVLRSFFEVRREKCADTRRNRHGVHS